MGDLSRHFNRAEFQCKGQNCAVSGHGNCGQDTIDYELIRILEDVREYFGKPVIITSGNRCAWHNQQVGGADNSFHVISRAADFYVKGVDVEDVADYLEDKAPGLGRYSSWVHVDTRNGGWARWSG